MVVFVKGEKVEICIKDLDSLVSFYEATVDSSIDEYGRYRVVSKLRIETVTAEELRPAPPNQIRTGAFEENTKVDVFVDDRWWVGEIVMKREEDIYLVDFVMPNSFIRCHISQMRRHLNWCDERWKLVA